MPASASLRTEPGTSSKAQHVKLICAARAVGVDRAELHDRHGSLRELSAADCSTLITKYSGEGLPHPPGQAPRGYQGKPRGTRIITDAHVDQILRLMEDYFGPGLMQLPIPHWPSAKGLAWLKKDFDVHHPRDLGTAARAGEVIRVLKQMLERKSKQGATGGSPASASTDKEVS